ncbi:histidine phosphatase family protein [Streptomyces clavuligerus]|uniref:Putative phosphoglycerate mutase n=1 Tax=Streptomyces clavuligerus TaxID=1901 RepID=E2Q3Q7_STRCL|nr:histidine phosphatase family protein [Streptomyces clavuligerus]ANW20204.1 phosphoglycerate mutase [Streptomyces clavuligerus]AXU14828.1 histidine phosphatase family protein [Streptomyces clavuligerus]EFG06877.1 putative phosphoglycerate mutase [Streptomyces clavuligerus]MBY6304864.1 histidine phosphatase family protein [Streptomyces clavuligerus]QCS07600.1 histidine phosphatase family protein [Streptomyces clavuligerus]
MTATLLLARHGQTVWHAENRYAGISDVALTPEGRAQAGRLAGWAVWQPHRPDAVWTSTVPRAIETAAPVCAALGLTPHREHDLRECDFGTVEGRTLAEFAAECPEAAAAFTRDPAAHPFPGAEDPRAAAARGAAALARIAAAHDGGRVLVVAHNTLFRLVLCALLGIPLGEYRRVFPALRNAAVTELRLAPGRGAAPPRAALLALNVPVEPPAGTDG